MICASLFPPADVKYGAVFHFNVTVLVRIANIIQALRKVIHDSMAAQLQFIRAKTVKWTDYRCSSGG